jgi:hypothetical protein
MCPFINFFPVIGTSKIIFLTSILNNINQYLVILPTENIFILSVIKKALSTKKTEVNTRVMKKALSTKKTEVNTCVMRKALCTKKTEVNTRVMRKAPSTKKN